MNLKEYFYEIDNRDHGQVLEGFPLNISPEDLQKICNDLSLINAEDIPEKYKHDIDQLLSQVLRFPLAVDQKLEVRLNKLLDDIREE